MESLAHYLEQMDLLLAKLVDVAAQLRDMSLQTISEKEVAPLQKKQDMLLAELETIDQQLHQQYGEEFKKHPHSNIHDQLEKFQQLNKEFIANLSARHGLIQFELDRNNVNSAFRIKQKMD